MGFLPVLVAKVLKLLRVEYVYWTLNQQFHEFPIMLSSKPILWQIVSLFVFVFLWSCIQIASRILHDELYKHRFMPSWAPFMCVLQMIPEWIILCKMWSTMLMRECRIRRWFSWCFKSAVSMSQMICISGSSPLTGAASSVREPFHAERFSGWVSGDGSMGDRRKSYKHLILEVFPCRWVVSDKAGIGWGKKILLCWILAGNKG